MNAEQNAASHDLLPVGLRLAGRRVVVVGGGAVALRRIGSLLAVSANVLVIAPQVVPALHDLAERGQVTWHDGEWPDDEQAAQWLDQAWLVLACTDSPQVNAHVEEQATAQRIWCSRADDATASTLWFPASARSNEATVAVFADRDPRRAVALRDCAVAAVAERQRTPLPGRAREALGRVVLVGGGPGDPGLLTRRGLQRLHEADVVVVDRLAPLAVLAELAEDVQIIDVSKVPRGPATSQEEINELLIAHALAGRVVVRFKGGDPFVFGRGMEELQACSAAGIAVEVVPGVTSAVSVPALAGIPVTHRGLAQGFTVVSGHLPPDHPESTLDWGALARTRTTLVCLMGVHSMPAIAAELLRQGLPGDTPVAAVADGGLASQRSARGTLAGLAALLTEHHITAPAVVIIGAVAGLPATMPTIPAPPSHGGS